MTSPLFTVRMLAPTSMVPPTLSRTFRPLLMVAFVASVMVPPVLSMLAVMRRIPPLPPVSLTVRVPVLVIVPFTARLAL